MKTKILRLRFRLACEKWIIDRKFTQCTGQDDKMIDAMNTTRYTETEADVSRLERGGRWNKRLQAVKYFSAHSQRRS